MDSRHEEVAVKRNAAHTNYSDGNSKYSANQSTEGAANILNAGNTGNAEDKQEYEIDKFAKNRRNAIIFCSVCAGLAIVCSIFAAINISILKDCRQTGETLKQNINEFNSDEPNLEKLSVSQQQTDSNYEKAEKNSWMQLPALKSEISKNAEISKELTEQIKQALNKKDETDENSSNSSIQSGQNSNNSSQKPQLTDEEKKKLDEILNRNSAEPSPFASSQPSEESNDSPTLNNTDASGAKPW